MKPLAITDRQETQLLNFCPICLAALKLPKHIFPKNPKVQWNSDFPVRTHLLCSRVVEAAGVALHGKNLTTLVKTEAPLWPLEDGMHNARATKLASTSMLSSFERIRASDQLVDEILCLPVEISLMIINYSIPSLYATCCVAENAVSLIKRRAPVVREIKLDLQRWPNFEKSIINQQSYITRADVKNHNGPITDDKSVVFQFDDFGCVDVVEHQHLKDGTVLTDFDRSDCSYFRMFDTESKSVSKLLFKGSVIRDISQQKHKSVFWDIPHKIDFKSQDCIEFWEELDNQLTDEAIRMRLLDNTRPLNGLTILSHCPGTVAVVLHHHDDEINLLPRLVKSWPEATIQYWPLQDDYILNYGYRTDYAPESTAAPLWPDLFFSTTNGLMIMSGRYNTPETPRYFSSYLFTNENCRPAYLAINEQDRLDIYTRFGGSIAVPLEKDYSDEELDHINDCSSFLLPEEIQHIKNIFAWKIDVDDGYDHCYLWYRDPSSTHITGMMFESLDRRRKAVLGQWRKDCKPIGPFQIRDGIAVENVLIHENKQTLVTEYAIVMAHNSPWSMRLSGKLVWWGGRSTNLLTPMPILEQ